MSPTKETQKSKGFTAEEKAAMKEHAKELKVAQNTEAEENAALEAIAKMQEPDRSMVRDACVCQQRRQDRLLLPRPAEVQREIRDVRLQRLGELR